MLQHIGYSKYLSWIEFEYKNIGCEYVSVSKCYCGDFKEIHLKMGQIRNMTLRKLDYIGFQQSICL